MPTSREKYSYSGVNAAIWGQYIDPHTNSTAGARNIVHCQVCGCHQLDGSDPSMTVTSASVASLRTWSDVFNVGMAF